MTFKSNIKKLRTFYLPLVFGTMLLALLVSNVSHPAAQQAYFWSEQEKIPKYYDSTEKHPNFIVDINHTVHKFNTQPLHLNDEALQASSTNWSEPVLLFEAEGTGELHYPLVIPDTYGNVHVFLNFKSGSQGKFDKIYYMRLDARGWTIPVDIVAATPVSDVNSAIGQDGYIYLTWQGAGDIILYSRAPIQGAEFVKNWSEPVPITNATNPYSSIISSPSGNIYLAYPDRGNSGVFLQVLDPNSFDRSLPRTVALNSLINTGSGYVQAGVSSNGTLHVVWTEFYMPENWPPRGVFYARSTDGGNNWSAPVLMAGDGFDQINITVLDDNNIHVAWNGMVGVGGRYHSWSSDGGQTWSETVEVIPAGIGGTEGSPQIVSDQSSTLHMLTTYEGCAWYTYFKNQRWAAPICISGGKARVSNYIEEPAMAVSEGNKLHAVFWDDRKRLWYTTKVTEASWIPPKIIDTGLIQPVQNPSPNALIVVTPTISSTGLSVEQQRNVSSKFSLNPGQILIFSLLPVMLLLVVIVLLQFNKRLK